jgi:hypothetical protein
VQDNNTGRAVIDNPNVNDTTFTATTTQALTPGHSFTWYVGAISTDGAVNSYNPAGQTFSLAPLVGIPTQTGPINNVAISAAANFDRPTFSWTAVTGADHYYLYVTDTTTGRVVVNNPNVGGGTFYQLTTAEALTPGHSFRWLLGADSADGVVNNYNPTGQTFSLAGLAPPTQTAPVGNIGTQTMPMFTWTAVEGADHYYLHVIDNTTGQIVIDLPKVTTTGLAFTPSKPLTRGHRYTWYLAAVSKNDRPMTYNLMGVQFDIS